MNTYIVSSAPTTNLLTTESVSCPTIISGASNIPWVHRSYHKRGDGTFRKKVFCFADGAIYSGNDVTGALTSRKSGFTPTAIPTHATMQVSGNSEMFVFIGEEI